MTIEVFQIILQVVIIVLGFYLAFLKSYFQEKGKNVATKEDIVEITQKIETVKSQVGLLAHKKISLATEKQKTLLEYNNLYSAWLNYILHRSIVDSSSSEASIEKTKEKIEQLYHDVLIAEAKLEVFFNGDDDLLKLKTTIKLKTLELSNHLSMSLPDARLQTRKKEITNELVHSEYKMEQLNHIHEDMMSVINKYEDEKLLKYKKLAPLNHEFIHQVANKVMAE